MVKFYPSWFIFFIFTLLGLSFVCISGNWFMVWIGLEFTLIGFLPMFSVSSLVLEGMIKYFFVQSGGSVLFIFSFLLGDGHFVIFIYLVSIFLKIGLFPFFYWVPVVMSSISWLGCLLLVTVQKVGPMFLLFASSSEYCFILLVISSASVFFSGLLGYNQSIIRPLMAYSSVSHTGWIMSVSIVNLTLALFYLFVYFFLNAALFILLDVCNSRNLLFSGLISLEKVGVGFGMLVLVGIPPFSLFYLNAMVIFSLSFYPIILGFMILGAFFSSYFYLSYFVPMLLKSFSFGLSRNYGIYSIFFISFIVPFVSFF